jgi:2,3-diketo-5-methylthio-1-phosphopentane phosphatase
MHVICDFDGTVSSRDTTDLVLERLARPAWRELEEAWVANRITAAECMRGQVALIDASQEALDSVLDTVELDPGFVDFVAWCDARAVPLGIVSDGVDDFILRILSRHGLERLGVIANQLTCEAGAWGLEQPWARVGCAAGSGVCKCKAATLQDPLGLDGTMVFVGDGRSDFCVAGRADILFAKDALADYAAGRAQPFHRFETFHDVTRILSGLVEDAAGSAAAVSRL